MITDGMDIGNNRMEPHGAKEDHEVLGEVKQTKPLYKDTYYFGRTKWSGNVG